MEPAAPDPASVPRESALLETNIKLWSELTDEAFEQYFRAKYFGEESLSREQAITRLRDKLNELREELGSSAKFDAPVTPGSAAAYPRPRGSPPVSAEFFPAVLPARTLSWHSLALSLLCHSLCVVLLSTVRLPARKLALIDFETEHIIYYKISQTLPNIAPAPSETATMPPKRDVRPASRSIAEPAFEARAEQEVQIHPEAPKRAAIVVEQPDVREVSTLPKLVLPNILIHSTQLDPGAEPIIVSAQVAARPQAPSDLLKKLQQSGQQLNVADPLPLAATPELAGTRAPALNLGALASQKLNLTLPVEPSMVTSEVSQLSSRTPRFGPARAPVVAPPVEEPKVNIQVAQLPAAAGPNLVVYSTNPVLPRGELAVPKVNASGRITAGPESPALKALPPGAAEIGRAEVVIPSISIKNHGPMIEAAPGIAVVQVPLPPKPPAEETKKPKTEMASLLDFLPSRLPSRSVPSFGELTSSTPAESPLQEYERQGGPVYTAAINAPNFTSKRGSWIFRFAEISPAGHERLPSLGNGASSGQESSEPSLTAPSATVKVDPKYPPDVVREKVEGVVVLFAIIRKDGTVDPASVRVVRKLDPRLDVSSRDALLGWRFKPSLKDGRPIDIQTEITIPFYFRREGS
jgi:protein TonB